MIIGVHKCRSTKTLPVFAWGIMAFQGMLPWDDLSWNHISCSYVDEANHIRFFDATGKYGFEEKSAHTFFKTNKFIGENVYIRIPWDRRQLLDWIYDNEPLRYDKSDVFGDALRIVGLLTANKYGNNYKKLTCNKVPLKLLNDSRGINFGDPDNFDLLTTWEIIDSYRIDRQPYLT